MRNVLGMISEFKNRTHKTKGGGVAIMGNAQTKLFELT